MNCMSCTFSAMHATNWGPLKDHSWCVCRYYNMPSSDYYQIANKLQAFVDQYLATTVVAAASAEEVA